MEWVLLSLLPLGAAGWAGLSWWQKRKREAIRQRPFPQAWRSILEQNVPLYNRLPEPLKQELYGHIHLFLASKVFHGFNGLQVTDEMRLMIAANACILLLNRPNKGYQGFSSIYIYPTTFVSQHRSWDGVVESVSPQARLGESWHRGPLVLAWDSVQHGTHDIKDGHNVVLHEFAHKLDGEDGAVDGAPIFHQRSQYVSWARVMRREFAQLRQQAAHGVKTVMDHYGATEPAEFFAVLTETFYEKPWQLKKHHPDLYQEMQLCFNVDPLAWYEQEAHQQD